MDTNPKENPKEGFKIMHECMLLTQEQTDGHESFGACLALSARRSSMCKKSGNSLFNGSTCQK
jgi:hypothetical protein